MTCEEFMRELDAFVDGEMTAEQENALFEHAERCAVCAQELQAALTLRDTLTDLDEPVVVPLDVQASWRRAVRREANRKKLFCFSRAAAGIAAAVCVCVLGIGMKRGSVATSSVPTTEFVVEADGGANEMQQKAVIGPAEYTEVTVIAQDKQTVREQLNDLCEEYSAAVDQEATDGENSKVYVTVPQDNAEEFFMALDALGTVEGTAATCMCINLK